MIIENYMSPERFSQYYLTQSQQIAFALSELQPSWEHADCVRTLLEETQSALTQLYNQHSKRFCTHQLPSHERKIEKYATWVEVARLASFQYGRFTNQRFSVTEGLYSTLLALAVQHCTDSDLKNIIVAGCGPGRTVLDFALSYPNASVMGMDYSLLSLVVARHILEGNTTPLQLPFRDVSGEFFSSLLTFPSFSLDNVRLSLCDLTEPQSVRADLIICSNTINLLPDHEHAIANISNMLYPNGIIIFADLIGWRLDRSPSQTVLRSDISIADCFARHNILQVEGFSGGPYIERETPENYTIYHEHFFVGKKRGYI